jgi:hypothetical protein
MQDVVMWWYGIEPQHEWDDVVAMADPDADINVYFVWEYEQDYDSNTDTGGATLGTDILIEDNLSSLARNLSHEIGHSLSLADLYNAAEQPLLMYGYEDGHQKIRKSDADAANP